MTPTKEQKRVIGCSKPVIALNAPYGTGKTEVICRLIIRRAKKYHGIRCLTLTKEAAKTMEDRLAGLGFDVRQTSVKIGTFHSFAYGELKNDAHIVGFKVRFDVDGRINNRILADLIVRHSADLKGLDKAVKVLNDINKEHVGRGLSISQAIRKIVDDEGYSVVIRKIIRQLKETKRELGVIDFDDMVYYFWKLLKRDKQVLSAVVAQYPLMVVDEFQDTTEIQWKIMELLIGEGMHFVGAGDPFQTLFRFAGASHDRFRQLERIPGCVSLPLTQNFRSTNEIIDLSNELRSQITHYKPVKVWSRKHDSRPRVTFSYGDRRIKAVIGRIRKYREKGVPPKEIAVIGRFGDDLKPLSKKLRGKVSHTLYPDETEEMSDFVKIVHAIMKIGQNQGGEDQWRVVLPRLRGVGDTKVGKILEILKKENHRYPGLKKVEGKGIASELKKFGRLCRDIGSLEDNPHGALMSVIGFCRKGNKVRKLAHKDTTLPTMEIIAKRSATIEEFLMDSQSFPYGIHYGLGKNQPPGDCLTLSTIHKAKGKEFKVVIVMGPYDTRFDDDYFGTFKDGELIIDEIMILDTAITRCSRHLYLMFPMTHDDWEKKTHKKNPSIFIRNCDRKLYNMYSIEDDRKSKKSN